MLITIQFFSKKDILQENFNQVLCWFKWVELWKRLAFGDLIKIRGAKKYDMVWDADRTGD